MSQKANQSSAQNHTPTPETGPQKPLISGLSPDDDIGVSSEDTGQQPAPAPKQP